MHFLQIYLYILIVFCTFAALIIFDYDSLYHHYQSE